MNSALQAIFLLLAGATEKHLVRQVEHLKAENDILLNKLPKQIRSRCLKERGWSSSAKRSVQIGCNPLAFEPIVT